MIRLAVLAAAMLAAGTTAAVAAPLCAGPEGRRATARKECRPTVKPKPEPYDPDRLRAGSRPGFIDMGGGTEIRVGGRARMDYRARW